MLEARANLTKVGYVAGDDFPEDTETIESMYSPWKAIAVTDMTT